MKIIGFQKREVYLNTSEIISKDVVEYVNIELTSEDAQLFVKFRQYQDKFQALLEGKVFDVKNGRAILHFNGRGDLMLIESDLITYRNVKKI